MHAAVQFARGRPFSSAYENQRVAGAPSFYRAVARSIRRGHTLASILPLDVLHFAQFAGFAAAYVPQVPLNAGLLAEDPRSRGAAEPIFRGSCGVGLRNGQLPKWVEVCTVQTAAAAKCRAPFGYGRVKGFGFCLSSACTSHPVGHHHVVLSAPMHSMVTVGANTLLIGDRRGPWYTPDAVAELRQQKRVQTCTLQ